MKKDSDLKEKIRPRAEKADGRFLPWAFKQLEKQA
jgi:hypothetical protein